jgi:hypothetical protein
MMVAKHIATVAARVVAEDLSAPAGLLALALLLPR